MKALNNLLLKGGPTDRHTHTDTQKNMDLSTSCGSADTGEPGQRRDAMIESRAPFSARPGNQNSPLYPKLSRRQEVSLPLLQVFELNVKARADNSTLVQPARQIDHNLACSMVINYLKNSPVHRQRDGAQPTCGSCGGGGGGSLSERVAPLFTLLPGGDRLHPPRSPSLDGFGTQTRSSPCHWPKRAASPSISPGAW